MGGLRAGPAADAPRGPRGALVVDAIAAGGIAGRDAVGGLLWIGLPFAGAGAAYAAIFLGWLRVMGRVR